MYPYAYICSHAIDPTVLEQHVFCFFWPAAQQHRTHRNHFKFISQQSIEMCCCRVSSVRPRSYKDSPRSHSSGLVTCLGSANTALLATNMSCTDTATSTILIHESGPISYPSLATILKHVFFFRSFTTINP